MVRAMLRLDVCLHLKYAQVRRETVRRKVRAKALYIIYQYVYYDTSSQLSILLWIFLELACTVVQPSGQTGQDSQRH